VVPTKTVRAVLHALALGLPDIDGAFINGLEIRSGYGNAVHVKIRTPYPDTTAMRHEGADLRALVEAALGDQKGTVSIAWSSA
jgi:hypothetical protein